MTDQVYYNETIEETSFPEDESVIDYATRQSTSNDTYSNEETESQAFPYRKVAHELISSSLNTKSKKILGEFEFTQSGALQIGQYENGISGDVKISPAGIVARNSAGTTTFTLDGETGDATFKGTIQTGAIVSGIVAVGDNNVVIDGDAKRIVVYDDDGIPRIILGYQAGGF